MAADDNISKDEYDIDFEYERPFNLGIGIAEYFVEIPGNLQLYDGTKSRDNVAGTSLPQTFKPYQNLTR
jgi:hypothetical protein